MHNLENWMTIFDNIIYDDKSWKIDQQQKRYYESLVNRLVESLNKVVYIAEDKWDEDR
jgi:hypothetical protein